MVTDKAFGLSIRKRRQELQLSQESLAFRAGLHRTYVSQIERGIKSPSLRVMSILAVALQMKVHILIQMAEDIDLANNVENGD